MRAWLALPLLALLLGCPGQPPLSTAHSNKAQIAPAQILVRPGSPAQDLKAQVIQNPAGGAYPISLWLDGTFHWEILGTPTGVDGGHFLLLDSGTIRAALLAGQIDQRENLLQNYVPPTALPSGTTRLELKIRVTITPQYPSSDGGIAQTDIPLVIDVNAPALPPSPGTAHEVIPAAEETRGPR